MQGLMRLARASHGYPRTPYAVNKDHPRASTVPHSRPRPMRTPPCVRPAASPDAHVHACSDVVARSRPRPPDMHGRSVLDAHDPSCPPACPHLAASPDAHAHSPPSSFPRSPSTTTDVHAPTSAHCPALTLTLALSPPSPNSDVVTTTTRRSCRRDRHAVVVTTRPPRPGPSPLPALSCTPSRSQQRRGDDDDTTIVLSRSSRRRCDHSPSPGPCPYLALARTPLPSQQRRGDDDDTPTSRSPSRPLHPPRLRARNRDVVTMTTRRSQPRDCHVVVTAILRCARTHAALYRSLCAIRARPPFLHIRKLARLAIPVL
ncbi:hypothetical protein EV363DRAFT_1591734 [Boletus edulis]|nr:hypothetical protein EV363DRAFT_1591734 [Boletus edulis]